MRQREDTSYITVESDELKIILSPHSTLCCRGCRQVLLIFHEAVDIVRHSNHQRLDCRFARRRLVSSRFLDAGVHP